MTANRGEESGRQALPSWFAAPSPARKPGDLDVRPRARPSSLATAICSDKSHRQVLRPRFAATRPAVKSCDRDLQRQVPPSSLATAICSHKSRRQALRSRLAATSRSGRPCDRESGSRRADLHQLQQARVEALGMRYLRPSLRLPVNAFWEHPMTARPHPQRASRPRLRPQNSRQDLRACREISLGQEVTRRVRRRLSGSHGRVGVAMATVDRQPRPEFEVCRAAIHERANVALTSDHHFR